MTTRPSFSPSSVFLWLALPLGLIYLLITPPFQSPDEQNHFYKGWHVSQGNSFATKTADSRLGGQIPVSLHRFSNFFMRLKNCPECNTNSREIQRFSSQPIDRDKKIFTDFANTGFYTPVGYLPQATAFRLGKWFDLPIGWCFYLGRIFNFLCWIILVYKGIQWAGKSGWLLFFLAVMPASLAFHISLNPDVLAHGMGFLFLGLFLRIFRGNIPPGFLPISTISLMVITFIKPTLLPLGLLLLLLPGYLFETNYKKLLIIILLLLPAITAFFITRHFSAQLFIPYDQYNQAQRMHQTLQPGADPAEQLAYIVDNPFQTTLIFIKSYFKALPSNLAHYTGKFGWEHHYLPAWMILLLLTGILISSQIKEDLFSPKQQIGLTGIFFFLSGSFSIVMYMLWTPVGFPELLNLQGRYFVLIYPLLLLTVPVWKKLKHPIWWLSLVAILLLTNLWMMRMIVDRYFV